MKKFAKVRWIGTAVVGGIALLGANASAVQQAVTAVLSVDPNNSNCPQPTGFVYAARAEGFGQYPSHTPLCMIESTGATATGNCFPVILAAPSWLQAKVGKVNESTLEFVEGLAAGEVQWGNNVSVSTGFWSAATGCALKGTATAKN